MVLSTYEDYVNEQRQQQQVLVSDQQVEEQKQVELRKIVYDELLKKYQNLLQVSKEQEDKIKTYESIIMEYMDKEGADMIVEVSHEKMRRILIEKQYKTIFLCFDKEKKLKWAKAPHECASRIP